MPTFKSPLGNLRGSVHFDKQHICETLITPYLMLKISALDMEAEKKEKISTITTLFFHITVRSTNCKKENTDEQKA